MLGTCPRLLLIVIRKTYSSSRCHFAAPYALGRVEQPEIRQSGWQRAFCVVTCILRIVCGYATWQRHWAVCLFSGEKELKRTNLRLVRRSSQFKTFANVRNRNSKKNHKPFKAAWLAKHIAILGIAKARGDMQKQSRVTGMSD
eukprot:6199422-Pleurochrysis_carterae.AAC.1